MRPKITTCRHIARSVNYNEQKVSQQKAERLTGANLLKAIPDLTADDVLHRFERRMELNDRVRTSLHITLNFDPQDNLSNEQMQRIARQYMKEIGFDKQPWMAWRHNDAGHPHCHIVTTHVQWNGDPIDLYKIGERQSESARQKIETEFKLVTAEMKKEQRRRQKLVTPDSSGPQRLTYGEQPLTRAMAGILEFVTEKFCYTQLSELNAILRLYNVEAYIGRPGTKLQQDHGLLYRALDEHGQYIGRPLRASFFDCKPTLDNLEKRFVQNLSKKEELKLHVETNVGWQLYGDPDNLQKIRDNLRWEHISMVLTQDRAGQIKEVHYIDFQNRVIFSGAELHDSCKADAVRKVLERQKERIAREQRLTPEEREALQHRQRRGLRLGL